MTRILYRDQKRSDIKYLSDDQVSSDVFISRSIYSVKATRDTSNQASSKTTVLDKKWSRNYLASRPCLSSDRTISLCNMGKIRTRTV